jgi:hypothetical protein
LSASRSRRAGRYIQECISASSCLFMEAKSAAFSSCDHTRDVVAYMLEQARVYAIWAKNERDLLSLDLKELKTKRK